MADFRQLALEFVLADDVGKQNSIAKQAASEIQNGDASSNPVARWVESVQPWMPGNNEDEVVEGQDTPDWTSRAKALEFLSRTLQHLDPAVLKPSQVKLLVGFFGAMFDVDHKAGVMASATALDKIREMKSFQPASGNEIISKLCALKDDFSRQTATTRLAVYQLLRSLMTTPAVAKDLQQRHGETASYMKELLQLCSSERDPDCLLVWFDIQRQFLTEDVASKEILEEVYNIFKAYFPITLPRIAQSNVTPDELKMALRRCFSANQKLAHLTIPFLVGKMDQGASVTVNVKIDILKTMQHCLENYEDKQASIAPYFNDIWGSLKYEVRNGESEDTIWATLEVLKTLATRLEGDHLRDYTLTVTRDCVTDLSNITYAGPSGRLLVAVMSASPSAFVMMVAPTITHLKENLRRPKTPDHNQDLLKILHVVLETRLLLSGVTMTDQEKTEFAAVDSVFKNLYNDVLRNPVQAGSKNASGEDELMTSMRAVQAVGALVGQVSVPTVVDSTASSRLLPDNVCLEVCNDLFTIFTQTGWSAEKKRGTDDVLNETTRSLHRVVEAYPDSFSMLLDQSMSIIRGECSNNSPSAVSAVRTLGPLLAFVGCSTLPKAPSQSLDRFLRLSVAFANELIAAIDANSDATIRSALAAGIESAFRYFNEACAAAQPDTSAFAYEGSWVEHITSRYPSLSKLGSQSADEVMTDAAPSGSSTVGETRQDFLLAGLAITRQVYLRVTVGSTSESNQCVTLRQSSSDKAAEHQFLHRVASLAGFLIHEMTEAQQTAVQAQYLALNLFQEDAVDISAVQQGDAASDVKWDWFVTGDTNVLAFGMFEALRPASITALFETGVAQSIITRASADGVTDRASVIAPILSILANKHVVENDAELVDLLARNAKAARTKAQENEDLSLDQVNFAYAILAGILRRYSSKKAESLLEFVREGPALTGSLGVQLAHRMEMLVAPQTFLTKANYAVVKPLWMQRVYFSLIGPMLQSALSADVDADVKRNYGVAVILMLKHMTFSIYEADAEKILAIAILTAQRPGSGLESLAALDVMQTILIEAPEKGQEHLRSIINICVPAFTTKPTGDAQAGVGKLALEIVGGLPKMFESRRLVQFVPQLERELTLACGHGLRDLRKLARQARQAWAPLK